MPQVDKPLEELRVYQGMNPRPADFDAYWDRALAALGGVDPAPEVEPARFAAAGVNCSHLWFRGVGGARIHAKLARPTAVAEPHPALLLFHGYTGNSGDWFSKLPWAAAGFTVAAMDCRGQGGLSEDPGGVRGNTHRGHIIRGLDDAPDRLLYRQIFLDTVQLARVVMAMDDVDETRVGCTGKSQGGGLTIACSALEPRIRRAAPVFPFLCDYKRVWDMDLVQTAYAELTDYFRRFDPTHAREQEIFTTLGYVDVQHLAPRIRGDVLFTTGLMDKTCPPSTQFAAYNKMTCAKELVLYPDFGHEQLPGVDDRIYTFLTGMQ